MALSMSDDELMTWRGTEHLFALYANAPSRIERIEPKALKLRRIGHFGFFRADMRDALWSRAVDVFSGWTKAPAAAAHPRFSSRSEERRVGKECRSRWSPYH